MDAKNNLFLSFLMQNVNDECIWQLILKGMYIFESIPLLK